ncbi:MAG: phosphoribosylformylglycinamidine synthase II, partial [Actinobacteria bacterium]|nr:phosphoribosylformylglycinamidine synthase II [Actinomycetota bacterium]
RGLVADDLLDGVHDVADGGLGVALAEMAAVSGVGARIDGVADHAVLFSEAPSRVVACIATAKVDAVRSAAERAGVPFTALGNAGGDRLVIGDLVDVAVAEVARGWREAVPAALGES